MVKQYRKIPGVIEAIQFTKKTFQECFEWLSKNQNQTCTTSFYKDENNIFISIQTPEGIMQATSGDYIIKDINKEFHICKPGTFKKTYNNVNINE